MERDLAGSASAAGKTTLIAPIAGSSDGLLASVQAFFEQPINIVSIMCALMVGRMAAYVGDQIMVQRLQTTKVAEGCASGIRGDGGGRHHLDVRAVVRRAGAVRLFSAAPAAAGIFSTDKILPYFMSLTFPRGIVGLVIASIMASSLSSVDSAINSCTSVVVRGFLQSAGAGTAKPVQLLSPWRRTATSVGRAGGDGGVWRARLRCWRSTCRASGSLLEIANKLVNAFTGPLFGIYLAGDVQPSRHGRAGLDRRGRRIVRELLRGVPHVDRIHVALQVWPGRDAAGRVRGDRRAEDQANRGGAAVDLEGSDSFESGVESR